MRSSRDSCQANKDAFTPVSRSPEVKVRLKDGERATVEEFKEFCKGKIARCPPKIEMSYCYQSRNVGFVEISNHQGLQQAPGLRGVWERAAEHSWRVSESEPCSGGQASAVCRSLARGALPPGDELSWQATASPSVVFSVAGAAPSITV